MKKLFFIFAFIILFTTDINSEIIKNIEISGNVRISDETIILFSEIKKNQDLKNENLNLIIKKLYTTNFFSDINIAFDDGILKISVKENPVVQTFQFKGIKNKRILEVLNDTTQLKEKSSFLKSIAKSDEKIITNILRSNGYYFAEVNSKIKSNPNNTVDLIYDVILGEKALITKIKFIGDKKIKDRELRSVIVSEEAKFWKFISRRKYLDINRIEFDEKLLTNYYKNSGYFNISVESSSAQIIDESNFELVFNINAGEKYYFNNLKLNIPENYSIDNFKNILNLFDKLKGKIYSLNKIEKILNEIDKIVLTKEFEFINAKYDEVITNKNKINFTIKLEETEKTYIERINIYGNYITDENVIRNSLIVDEGDAYNQILINKSINDIRSKNIFKSVKPVIEENLSKKTKIINIEVEEKPTGEIYAGAGTGTSGTSLNFGIKENNFLGQGKRIDTNFLISDTSIQGKLSLTNPNFRNSNKSLSTSIESTKTDLMSKFGYETNKTGFSVGTSFEQAENLYFSPSFSTYYETLDTSSKASAAKKKQDGSYLDAKFSYGLTLNKLNQNFQPSEGSRNHFSQDLPIFSDDWSFANTYTFSKYLRLGKDSIFSINFLAKTVNSLTGEDVRVSKRIFIPSRRLRGFEYGKIGPIDSGDYIGGNYASSLSFNSTLPQLFPTLQDIDFSLFFDAANVWGVDYNSSLDSSKIRSSTGLSIDWFTPIGPLSFSFAKPITKASSDSTETFRFDIGTSF